MLRRPAAQRKFTTPDSDTYIGEWVAYLNQMHLIVGRFGAGDMQTVDLDHGHIEELRPGLRPWKWCTGSHLILAFGPASE
ncbi:hypothetical protein GCM10010121_068840 [Streptomyces brasiliensis]|uniref:Uncharacterized protein n=1 Tax=Streptomyces brasiliensis TaxID=1954 RepID=A0A917L6I3_9ACTN|nr:hypothetical protein GCM10010121_068840 [Streptomyces brasiliensis]